MNIVLAAILCGVVAVLYGLFTSRSVLAASPGNEKMQEIAGAIQEGAKAYLGRHYRTSAIVGVPVAATAAVFPRPVSAIRFPVVPLPSGRTRFLGHTHPPRAQ